MLASADLIAFVATTDLERARAFYGDALGLRVIEDDGRALAFDAHGTTLRVTGVREMTPPPYTVLGWAVPDASAAVRELAAHAIAVERFDGFDQDEDGIWIAPTGGRVAWFKDPDGNIVQLTELPD
jgi:catechol 2,3-dioxygenase-like lactoylglutathione lyase family enzyme